MSGVKKERGQSLIEFALLLPISLLLIFGIIDLGMIIVNSISLRDAVQEAVLYASIEPSDHDGITARALNSTEYPVDITDATVVITAYDKNHNLGLECAGDGNMIEVTVNKPYQFITPLGGSINMGSTQVQLIIRPRCP